MIYLFNFNQLQSLLNSSKFRYKFLSYFKTFNILFTQNDSRLQHIEFKNRFLKRVYWRNGAFHPNNIKISQILDDVWVFLIYYLLKNIHICDKLNSKIEFWRTFQYGWKQQRWRQRCTSKRRKIILCDK